jgi:hypothetical protein
MLHAMRPAIMPGGLVLLLALLGCGSHAASAVAPPASSERADSIGTIIGLFSRYDVVGIPERHRSKEVHTFLQALIRDPRLGEQHVTDIVVEFGNARFQSVADRYVAGEDVPSDEVQRIWRDTGQFLVWDSPLYAQFLATVREINVARTAATRLRVVLGDPPIDWPNVHTKAEYEQFADRDLHLAHVIEHEVLANHHKALFVAGGMHLLYAREPAVADKMRSAGDLVHRSAPDRTFMFWHIDEPVGTTAPQVPQVVIARGTPLGASSFAPYAPKGVLVRRTINGSPQWVPLAATEWPRVATMADGLIYYGPDSPPIVAPADVYADPVYVAELRRRAAILSEVYGMDFGAQLDEALGKPN